MTGAVAPVTGGADVVVVGAGIVGAAVAYEAARAGADVVLLDRSLPGSGVTGDSFAWIGGPRPGDAADAGTPLRRLALGAYRRLEGDVPGVRVRWRGSLHLDEPDAGHAGDVGHGVGDGAVEHVLDRAGAARLAPHLRVPPTRPVHLPGDGAVYPLAVTRSLVRAAQGFGARLVTASEVTAVRVEAGRVAGVDASSGSVAAPTVVVTAGVGAAALCAALGFDLPVAPSPALLLRLAAPPGLVRTLVVTASVDVREAADGELLVAADARGEVDGDDLDRVGARVLRHLVDTFDGADEVRLLGVRVGQRPMPADGLPVVGPVPGVEGAYLAVMHSGVTLAPVVGRLVAAEVVRGVRAPELDGVRPDRFAARP